MFRATVFITAVVVCMVMSTASASAYNRDISVDDFEFDEDDTFPEDTYSKANNFGQLGSVIFAIKDQFKDIIEEITLQLFKYVVEIMKHYKVKLLKKLGMYTLSDVFHTIFDGVTDFVVDTTPEVYSEEAILKPAMRPNYYSNPYGLSSLFKSS